MVIEVEAPDDSINVGNYRNLVKLHSRHIELLQNRLESGPKNASLLGHDYQNSMSKVLGEGVLAEQLITSQSSLMRQRTSVRKSK